MELCVKTISGITTRFVFRTDDNYFVKTALVKRPEKTIICLSSQIGCIGRCKFCSAANIDKVRNLTPDELIDMARITDEENNLFFDDRRTLISFMGTGEPMDNVDGVIAVHDAFTGDSVKFALSVSGFKLDNLKEIPTDFKVQFTLISTSHLRRWLQPHVEPLACLDKAIVDYEGEKEINVPLIRGLNDYNMEDIACFALASKCPVKLNKFHPLDDSKIFECSVKGEALAEYLRSRGVTAEYYETDGEDIHAACGQFEIG